ncbi:MAG: translation initiation factor IF-2 [Parcubacteria bacterium C7867-001]|nr:MAG: translation initiation factor IF-2 [Parcubacteria bacterium C7867-001]
MARTPRPPIVAVMGHVDHGKSSLLDYIRKANVTATEAGGITQHVSAYVAEHEHEGTKRRITFLDTPGHEAFRALRSRGAKAADVAVLVIAADEGVKPQTKESYDAIMESGIPFVVAFTKIDKNGADVERAKISALEAGIYLEGLGGSISFAGVSSKSGEGVPELLDLVLLTADLAELTCDLTLPAEGFILESTQDPKRGLSATLIIKEGTLSTGAFVVADTAFAPIRFIEDFAGNRITEGKASEPVSVSGFSVVPPPGTPFTVAANKKEAEKIASAAAALASRAEMQAVGDKTNLPLVIKADVTGSLDAILYELSKIEHENAALRVISSGVGSVSENDVKTAQAAQGIVIGFHVDVDSSARDLADRSGISIETFTIIYELNKRVADLLTERAPKVQKEEILAQVKILKTFNRSGNTQVIGARVESGVLSLGDQVKLTRRDIELDKGKITNLQVARADVKDVKEGEFGAEMESKTEPAAGDYLVAFRITQS